MEDKDKWAGIGGDASPWQQRKQNRQRADIKNQDAIDNLISGFGDALFRVIGFSGGDPYQLQSAERKHNNGHHHHQPGPAMRQKAALFPQVAHGGLRTSGIAEE
ncbi:Uncharacterised protein [Salmonella enterica subsp. enterica serovar Bovismorbificans]|uniref:Uncharacterized protein n=1 Tax=Salmonella enterica subsp. enterica serovar Bovismorbificans TaxID=58097 RepID=A0A655CH30_SALET|nr:Uncharacterised protein [Salmonella enterica subsp. enterica serovar Bovismorbificans]CNU80718.1 Uncharacterised protein [Salmonella enterica subsp. enterica serovar Bovismorbificans]